MTEPGTKLKPATPLPWILQEGFNTVYAVPSAITVAVAKMLSSQTGGDLAAQDNGKYLVHACNSLPALEAEVKRLRVIVEAVRSEIAGFEDYHTVEAGHIRAALEAKP